MPKPSIVLLCGTRRAGKDTVANRLRDKHGYTHLKFAGPIYEAVAAMTGKSPAWLEENKNVRLPMFGGNTVRHVLQTLGTDWGRDTIYEDIWTTRARERVALFGLFNHNFVFSDCRFPNEYDVMQAMAHRHNDHCALVKVVRTAVHMQIAAEQDGTDSHASELSVMQLHPDVTFHNDSSIEELLPIVDAWIASFSQEMAL